MNKDQIKYKPQKWLYVLLLISTILFGLCYLGINGNHILKYFSLGIFIIGIIGIIDLITAKIIINENEIIILNKFKLIKLKYNDINGMIIENGILIIKMNNNKYFKMPNWIKAHNVKYSINKYKQKQP
jgi:hypothetical protein